MVYLASGTLSLEPGSIRFESKKIQLKIEPETVRGIKTAVLPNDLNTWILVEYDEGGSIKNAAFKDAGLGRETMSIREALISTWLSGAPAPEATPTEEEIAAAVESLHTSRVETAFYSNDTIPRNVWSLVFAPGVDDALLRAYRAEDPDDLYRFSIIVILNRRAPSFHGEKRREKLHDVMIDALRTDSFVWIKVEALDALRRLLGEEEMQQEIEALMEGESGPEFRLAWTIYLAGSIKAPPLYVASQKGWNEVVARLIDNGANLEEEGGPAGPGWTPLMIAAAENKPETVKLLLARGANPDAKNAQGRTPVMFAAHYGYTRIVEMLSEAGADLDVGSKDDSARPALIAAALNGHAATVAALLRLGADAGTMDADGVNALMHVSGEDGAMEVMEALLAGGADVNAGGPVGTPLAIASAVGRLDKVKVLIEGGAEVDRPYSFSGIEGITPLMIAASEGHEDVVRMLMEHGADLNARNSLGASALIQARMAGHEKVVDLLRGEGAKDE